MLSAGMRRAPVALLMCLSVAAIAAVAGAADRSPSPTPKGNAIRWSPCKPGSLLPRAARCGWLDVPETRSVPGGRSIALKIIVSPAIAPHPPADAIFFLAGGPGQGAATLAEGGGDFIDYLRTERTVVFVDQRGTGGSNPLRCELVSGPSVAPAFAEIFPFDAVTRCRDALAEHDALTSYGTDAAVQDLEDVRAALAIERLDFVAGSYGTLVAQHYVRRHGDRVRALVLQSGAPIDYRLPLPFARAAEDALAGLFAACRSQPACARSYPDLERELAGVLQTLAERPVKIAVPGGEAGGAETVALSREVFAERLRLMLYGGPSAVQIPYVIHRAAVGDFAPFAEIARAQLRSGALALGMYFSVTCAEGVARLTDGEVERATAGTFLGDGRVRAHQRACAIWPQAAPPSDFFAPLHSPVPALVISGEFDPATPPSAGAAVVAGFVNGRQVVVKGAGHAVGSPCTEAIAARFLRDPGAALDTGCADAARPLDFRLPATAGATPP